MSSLCNLLLISMVDFARTIYLSISTVVRIKSTYFIGATNRVNTSGVNNNNPDNSICSSTSTSVTNRLFFKSSQFSSLDDFKTWLTTHDTDVVYPNGVSTSLPADVQEAFCTYLPYPLGYLLQASPLYLRG